MTKFPRGAIPTPRHQLAAAIPYKIVGATPTQIAYVPSQLSFWLNNVDGDCVVAEEAFKVACLNPEVLIEDAVVQTWASQRGVLNGAVILQVIQWMQQAGFSQGGNLYNAGATSAVDYSDEPTLQNAISNGPVKLGIDADALPQTAGQQMGWYCFGGTPDQFSTEDHCVSICGYGPIEYLFSLFNVPVPAGAPATGYLIFTWNSIGIVDHPWIMSCAAEAWLRTPSNVVVGPTPPPTPTPTPIPPIPPDPPPLLIQQITFDRDVDAGDFVLQGTGHRVSGNLSIALGAGTYTLND